MMLSFLGIYQFKVNASERCSFKFRRPWSTPPKLIDTCIISEFTYIMSRAIGYWFSKRADQSWGWLISGWFGCAVPAVTLPFTALDPWNFGLVTGWGLRAQAHLRHSLQGMVSTMIHGSRTTEHLNLHSEWR